MKKRITISTAVAVALLTAILTFQITFVLTLGYANDKFSAGGVSDSEFINEAVNRLTEIDSAYRQNYIGKVDNEKLLNSILKGYVAGTEDLYGYYFNDEELADYLADMNGEGVGIGVSVIYNTEFKCIEIINVYPDSPALEAGLEAGDLIVYVGEDKTPVSELGYEASIGKVRGTEGTEAVIHVLRGDDTEVKEYRIKRAKITEVSVLPRVSTLDKTVGIVKVTSFDTTTADQFKKAVEELTSKGCDKFVFDMRGNPGGELNSVVNTLDYLLPEGPVIRIFDSNGKQVDEKKSNAECINYPMAVIVNGDTASAAELFTSALMDYDKATVVGEITYGKGSMQTTLPLSDGGALKLTYRLYKPPYSEGYDGVGITPDLIVSLSEEAAKKNIFKLADEEDDQLIAAIASFKKQ